MSKHDYADNKYGKGKKFTLDDYTRDMQFSPLKKGTYPRFFLQYTNRLFQIAREMIDELEERVALQELGATDYRMLDRIKALYDQHLTASEEQRIRRDWKVDPKDYLR